MTIIDDELGAYFADQRVRDARGAPAFRPMTRSRRRVPVAVWATAAALAAVVLGLSWRRARAGDAQLLAADIVTWQSPTRALLRAPAPAAPSSLLQSVLDGAASAASHTTIQGY